MGGFSGGYPQMDCKPGVKARDSTSHPPTKITQGCANVGELGWFPKPLLNRLVSSILITLAKITVDTAAIIRYTV
jgi:hypothetical protein